MSHSLQIDLDSKAPPFDQLGNIHRLAPDRSGHKTVEHVRHQLYVARDKQSRTNVLIKLTTKPGLIYQQNLANEIASLSTINRELPDSRYFPFLQAHGRLRDGRVYLIMSLFDEFPLATGITTERVPARMVGHLRTAIEVGRALADIHRLEIFHVDLNPMNILHRTEKGRPVVRLIDFESSYEASRHGAGDAYNPSITPGYSAPEVTHQTPDGRSDVYSLGAVLYTMVAGYEWTWGSEAHRAVEQDDDLDPDLRDVLRKAVAPDPAGRYVSMQEFHGALAGYLEHIWPGRAWGGQQGIE
jgi:serine/threonine protein kinase